jgi:hypothetical protein
MSKYCENFHRLLGLAETAATDYEKASVFAATSALVKQVREEKEETAGIALISESLLRIQSGIACITGFEESPQGPGQDVVFVLGAINTLEKWLNG